MIRPLLFALPAALALLAAAPAAHAACSCTKNENARQFVQFNDVIFKGRAVSSKTQYGVTTTTFRVLEKLKGSPARSVAVTHPALTQECGGIAFKPGQTVIIVAQGMPDDLATGSCQINAYPEAELRRAIPH
jgi:hypothetical protein